MKGGTVQINWHDTQPVLTLDFHPRSGFLATGGNDHDIKIWIIESDKSEKGLPTALYQNSLSYHSSAVNALRFSPSGEYLASGADGGELLLWKLQPTNEGQSAWKVHKSLLFHRKDVLDLEWSPNGSYLISGSVDNSCIIWDINKGSVHQILDAHLHYVQGVAWDPLGQYVASLSSDRTCRIYANKPQNKSKGNFEKLHFVCQHTLTKSEPPISDDSKGVKMHLFHDETLPSFFRRLSWSPDGSFLLIPAGVCKYPSATEIVNTAYILSRRDLSRPAIQLPGASKAIVAIRFCPIIFNLINNSNSDTSFKLLYRVIFAVATLNSLYIYDTQSIAPIAIFAGLHYAAITDISWSIDAKYLAVSSRDGYCTIIEFDNDELGQPYVLSEGNKMVEENAIISNMEVEKVDNMEIDNINGDKLERENNNEIKGEKVERENNNEIKGDELERENNNEIKGEKVERENNNEIKEDVQPKSIVRDNNNNKPAKKRIRPIAIN